MKNILISCDTFTVGGAETFTLRMARAYKEKGHKVFLGVIYGDRINYDLVKNLAGDIEIISFKLPGFLNWLLYKWDGIWYKLGIKNTVRRKLSINKFRRFVTEEKIDVVHTNMGDSFSILNTAIFDLENITSIHTVHADILGYAHTQLTTPHSLKWYFGNLENILKRVNYIVSPAQTHYLLFKSWNRFDLSKWRKIYYPVYPEDIQSKSISRKELGIPENAFVYGVVSRCIEAKGWNELILAFRKAEIPGSYLVMIGDGSFLIELKQQYNDANILFLGNKNNPLDYLRLLDVGVSPTKFWESLPTNIIEYLSAGLPVVCTDNADSRYIIDHREDTEAGILVSIKKDEYGIVVKDDPINIDELGNALKEMYENKELYNRLKENTRYAFKKFDPEKVIQEYTDLMR